jgi:cobalt-zinc-cadmium efflux system outer membrane protein
VKPLHMTLLTLSVAALVAAPLAAQDQPKKLTLHTALEMASRQNLDLVAARARRAVAQAGIQIAKQRPNPTASFGALRDSPHESLFFDQPLEIGSKRSKRVELAQQEVGLTDVDNSTLERQVRRNAREAFYNLALARGITRQKAEALKLAERLEGIAKARFEAGDVPQLEVAQASLEAARERAAFQVAQQEEKISLSQLNAILNEPSATDWQIEGALDALPARSSVEEMIARASGSNPGLQRIAQEVKVEQTRESLLKAERIPNLGLEFGVDFNAPPDFRAGPRGQLSMALPLFTRNQGEIAQSSASQRALDSEAAAARRAVAGRVEAAYFELDAREAEVDLYRRTLLPATQQLESMAEESYRAGKSAILTVLDAQRNVQQVQQNYLLSLFTAQAAFARLEETVGAPFD